MKNTSSLEFQIKGSTRVLSERLGARCCQSARDTSANRLCQVILSGVRNDTATVISSLFGRSSRRSKLHQSFLSRRHNISQNAARVEKMTTRLQPSQGATEKESYLLREYVRKLRGRNPFPTTSPLSYNDQVAGIQPILHVDKHCS